MQPAEIDAEAFSFRVMQMYGLESYPVRRNKDEEVNKKIEMRAKGMCCPSR
jgi:hypothetical protein